MFRGIPAKPDTGSFVFTAARSEFKTWLQGGRGRVEGAARVCGAGFTPVLDTHGHLRGSGCGPCAMPSATGSKTKKCSGGSKARRLQRAGSAQASGSPRRWEGRRRAAQNCSNPSRRLVQKGWMAGSPQPDAPHPHTRITKQNSSSACGVVVLFRVRGQPCDLLGSGPLAQERTST